MNEELKKSGFVVLVGRSNTGKSTLINSLVGTKVAITTPKPQTTRHLIHGVLHDARGQVVFVDTPGIFHKTKDILTRKMNIKVREALKDIEVIVYVVDPCRPIGPEERELLNLVDVIKKPKILAINKTDLRDPPHLEEYRALAKNFDQTLEISALTCKNLNILVDAIFEYLSPGPAYYPDMQLTNVENKFWFSELIREKVFLKLKQEVPYSTAVEIDDIQQRENGVMYIKARILTNATRYKSMIIGKGGRMIKSIGQAARKEMEAATQKKVFLDLEVEVQEHWAESF